MPLGLVQIRFRKRGGRFFIQGIGRTARGVKVIRDNIEISAKGPADPAFKTEVAAAVITIFDNPD